MKQLWKFLYWPLLWAATLYSGYILCKYPSCRFKGVTGYASIIIGLIIIAYSLLLTSIGGRTLKRYGHVKSRLWPDKLVTVGIYSCMRHPQHLGLSLFPVGLGLLARSLGSVIASGWAVVGALLFVLMIEEPECLNKYGEDYYNYMRRVPAFSLNPGCIVKGIKLLYEE